jgi:hypothetical protein
MAPRKRTSEQNKAAYARRDRRAREEGYESYAHKRKITSKKLAVAGHIVRLEEAINLALPTEYPSSTRCQAFKFVPYPEMNGVGNLYMRFIKYGTPWVYRDVPEGTYYAFASAPSKGRAVNTILNPYSAGEPSSDEYEMYFTDM